ncbi:MAG: phenylalanine--tRNA ligase subunit beta [Pseudomonadota bacterium]
MKKAVLIFILAVLLPALLLGYLSLQSARQQGVLIKDKEAQLRQQQVDALATQVALAVRVEHESFVRSVEQLAAQYSSDILARDFNRLLSQVWSRPSTGFSVGGDWSLLSPQPISEQPLDLDLEQKFITETFNNLEMQVKYDKNQWYIIPSSYRFDIKLEVDLIEELARIYSYDSIQVKAPSNQLTIKAPNQSHLSIKHLREVLINRDYQEVITYSFVDPEINKLLNNNEKNMILSNPIAPELSEMRTSLLPGLLSTLQYNIKRQQERMRIFESGLVYQGTEKLQQDSHIAGLIYGNINKKQWDKENILCDFYDLKNDVEALFSIIFANELTFSESKSKVLHPGQAVDVFLAGKELGFFGQLHPKLASLLDLKKNTYVFEFNMNNIVKKDVIRYQPISKFPSIRRDMAIVLDEKIPYADVLESIKNDATDVLSNLELFDVYQGEGIEKKKKSLALGLTFQVTSSTLKDEEVETIMGNVLDGLYNKFGAKLR